MALNNEWINPNLFLSPITCIISFISSHPITTIAITHRTMSERKAVSVFYRNIIDSSSLKAKNGGDCLSCHSFVIFFFSLFESSDSVCQKSTICQCAMCVDVCFVWTRSGCNTRVHRKQNNHMAAAAGFPTRTQLPRKLIHIPFHIIWPGIVQCKHMNIFHT